MKKLRIFYELDGSPRWEEFEPIIFPYKDRVYTDYHSMLQRAFQYAECALPEIGARKVSVVWDV